MVKLSKSWQVQKCTCTKDTTLFEEDINSMSQLIRDGMFHS